MAIAIVDMVMAADMAIADMAITTVINIIANTATATTRMGSAGMGTITRITADQFMAGISRMEPVTQAVGSRIRGGTTGSSRGLGCISGSELLSAKKTVGRAHPTRLSRADKK